MKEDPRSITPYQMSGAGVVEQNASQVKHRKLQISTFFFFTQSRLFSIDPIDASLSFEVKCTRGLVLLGGGDHRRHGAE
jgi:hypothetical protein